MNKHTFVILAHKQSRHLQECIDSLKKQTVPSEMIICSSTPSNFLENIAHKNNLKLIINPDQNGIASDWNFALKQAQTKYITLAHQDDIYSCDYTKKVLDAMESRNDSLLAFSDYGELVHTNNSTKIRSKSHFLLIKKILNFWGFRNKNYLVKNKIKLLMFGNPIGCPAVTYCMENLGDFQFDSRFTVNLDWDAWCRLSKVDGSFHWIKEQLVMHRIHEESETTQGLRENRRQKEDLHIFKRIWPGPIANLLTFIYSLSYKNNK